MLTQRLETRAGLVQKRQADADKENQPANSAPEPCDDNTERDESTKRYNRKEKSLKKLCKDFVALYSASDNADICLDTAAEQLGVERRRIYDIINVLESVQVVERRAKNKYAWCGLQTLQTSIPKLRLEALSSQNQDESSTTSRSSRRESRKDKSLGITCRKFLHLFLQGELNTSTEQFEAKTLSLDEAAETLIAQESEANNKLKTKIRRLYDIANILASIQLIEKVQTKSRKPSFRWIYQLAAENKSAVTGVNASTAPSVQSLPVKKRREALKERTVITMTTPAPSLPHVPVSVTPVIVSNVTPRTGLTFTFNSPPRRVSPRLNPQSPSKTESVAVTSPSSTVLTLLSQQPQEVQTQMWHSINQLVMQQLGDKRKLEQSSDEHVSKRARIDNSTAPSNNTNTHHTSSHS